MDYDLNLPPDKRKYKELSMRIPWHEWRKQYESYMARYVVVSQDGELGSKKTDEAYIRLIINGVYADIILQKKRQEESASPGAKRIRPDPSDGPFVRCDNGYIPFGEISTTFDRLRLIEDISKNSGYKPRNIAVFCDLFMSSSDLIFTNPFNYIEQSTRVLELEEKMEIPRLTVICQCKRVCEPETCPCLQLNAKCFGDIIEYTDDGKVLDKMDYLAENKARNHNDTFLVMCGSLCGCGDECKHHVNKLTGINRPFEIFRNKLATGFGTRVLKSIAMGEIVCEVVGSVAPVEFIEDSARKMNYSMDLYSRKSAPAVMKLYKESGKKITRKCELKANDEWCIEMLYQGNISRFINHGCFPNVAPIRVVANYLHPTFHRIFLMAVTPIPTAFELFLNYDNLMLKRDFVCKCRDEYKHNYYALLTSDEFVDEIFKLDESLRGSILGFDERLKRHVEAGETGDKWIGLENKSEAAQLKFQSEDKELAAKNASYFVEDEMEMNIRILRTVQNSIKLPISTKAWQYQFAKSEWDRYDTEIENLQDKVDGLRA